MLRLNDDFSEIERQISVLDEYFHRTGKKDNIMACYQTYYSLIFFETICSDKNIKPISLRGKDYIANMVNERSNQIYNKFRNNFLNNKKFHVDMLVPYYEEVGDMLGEYCCSSEYMNLFGVYNKPLDSKSGEDLDLLINFFKDVNPKMCDLFLEMVAKDRFYRLDPLFSEHSGLTVLNPIEKICNVFIKERVSSIGYLSTFVHEMGHVFDEVDYMNRFSVKDTMKYMNENFYIEVLSTYYEQKFYEWLLENNIRREETKLRFVDFMTSYLDVIGDAILFSLIPDEYHNAAVAGFFTRDYLISVIDDQYDLIDELADDSIDGVIPDFDDSFNYGYGIMVANGLMHDEDIFNKFLNIRNGMFDREKLIRIGVTPEVAGKKLVKNMDWFINK